MKVGRHPKRMDNKGSTLIEIVVSVLIIGIIFVPLLMGMSNALKANSKAEESLHAETVAANCIEVAKTYGMAGFTKVKSDPTILSATSVTGNGSAYNASGISEGLNTYNVEIRFNNTRTSGSGESGGSGGLLNDYKYTDFESIMGAYTVTHTALADTTRLNSYKVVSGLYENTIPVPSSVDMKSLVLRKQTVLTIDKYPNSGANANRYHIDSSVSYLVNNHSNVAGKFYFDNGGDTHVFEDTTSGVQICGTECPETVILFYAPLTDISNLNKSGSTNKEYIFINNKTGNDINVYVFISGDDLDIEHGIYPTDRCMYFGVSGGHTKVFCSSEPRSYEEIYTSPLDISYINTLNPGTMPSGLSTTMTIPILSPDESTLSLLSKHLGKMVYDVNVTVKDGAGNFVTSKTATIIE